MKILVICQYYYPEPFRISDICEELSRRGNEITVVTGTPNYPMGEIYAGFENGAKTDEILNGVRVHRCKTVPRKTGILHRIVNYYSYARQSRKYVCKLKEEYDVVLINQLSPVMMAKAGIAYAKKHKKKTLLYCLDLWPESLVAGGIQRNSLVFKLFRRESAKVYKNVDRIVGTSRSFGQYFSREFGINDTEYLPQYAEDIFDCDSCKKKSDGYIDLMFAGNVGTAQSVETLVYAAKKCSDLTNLRWHIVGDGVELEKIKKLSGNLPITFHGRKPVEEMPKLYAMADAMLVTMQRNAVLSYTLPGKVQTYMAAGKPIIGAIDGEAESVIEQANCGYIAPAEDADKLAECVRTFISDRNQEMLGYNARDYYERHFSKNHFFSELEKQLEGLAGRANG